MSHIQLRNTNSRLRIVVGGLVGLYPVGGVAWDYLQYVIGLSRLGHEVCYHEDTRCWPYHPMREAKVDTGDFSANFINQFFLDYMPDLAGLWHYQHFGDQHFGMSADTFRNFASEADVFLNISGSVTIPDCLPNSCRKVFLDTDPGYNQIIYETQPAWSLHVQRWRDSVDAHDVFCTYAECIGRPECKVPTLGRQWIPTRMPVVMDLWQLPEAPTSRPWSTVMTWNAFRGPLTYQGVEYGSKGTEFERIIQLPSNSNTSFQIAVGGIEAPIERLRSHGWIVEDAPGATRTASQYQSFIQNSCGEISTAKNVYVALQTGWFSCRSACYLASGRPTVLQDTGFSDVLPASSGVAVFTDVKQAEEGLLRIEADYPACCNAARDFAGDHFAAEGVLTRLLEDCFA